MDSSQLIYLHNKHFTNNFQILYLSLLSSYSLGFLFLLEFGDPSLLCCLLVSNEEFSV